MSWRSLCLLLLTLAGCGRGPSYILVTSRGHIALGATSLHLAISNAGQNTAIDVVPTADPFTFSLSFDAARTGAVDLTVDARAATTTLASRPARVVLAPGGVVEAIVDFSAPAPDLGADVSPGADSSVVDLAPLVDLSPSLDMVGVRCRALRNTGANMSGAITPPAGLLDLQNSFTVEGWVYIEQAAQMGGGVAVHGGVPMSAGWELGIAPNTTRPEFHLWNSVNLHQVVVGPTLTVKTWNHLAAEFDGGSIKLYVNGVGGNKMTVAGPVKYPMGPAPFLSGDRLNGFVDEIRVSNTARYVADFTPAPTFVTNGNTVVLYHMDEMGGGTTADVSGNNLTANIVGMGSLSAAPCF